jgi:hypothetical protein
MRVQHFFPLQSTVTSRIALCAQITLWGWLGRMITGFLDEKMEMEKKKYK